MGTEQSLEQQPEGIGHLHDNNKNDNNGNEPGKTNDKPVIDISASLAAIQARKASNTRVKQSEKDQGEGLKHEVMMPVTPLKIKTQFLDEDDSDEDEEAIRNMLLSPAMSEMTMSPSWNSTQDHNMHEENNEIRDNTGRKFRMKVNNWNEDVDLSYAGRENSDTASSEVLSVHTSKSLQATKDGFELAPTVVFSPNLQRRGRIKDDRSAGSGTLSSSRYHSNAPIIWEDSEEGYDHEDDVSLLTSNSAISKIKVRTPRSPTRSPLRKQSSKFVDTNNTDETLLRAANSMSAMSGFMNRQKKPDPQDESHQNMIEDEILYTEYHAQNIEEENNEESLLTNFLALKQRIEAKEVEDIERDIETDVDNYEEMLEMLDLDSLSQKEGQNSNQNEHFQNDKNKWLVSPSSILACNDKKEVKPLSGGYVIGKADHFELSPKSPQNNDKKSDYNVVRYTKGLRFDNWSEPDYKGKHRQSIQNAQTPKSILKISKYSPNNSQSVADSHLSLKNSYPKVKFPKSEGDKKGKKPAFKLLKIFGRQSKSKSKTKNTSESFNVGINSSHEVSVDLKYVQPIYTYKHDEMKVFSNNDEQRPHLLPRIADTSDHLRKTSATNWYFTFAAYSLSTKAPNQDLLPNIESQDDASIAGNSTSRSIVSALTHYGSEDEDDMNLTIASPDDSESGAILLFAFLLKRSCKQSFGKWYEESIK